MRDILTGLAIIIIVVLTTLLVAPYFVDWNGQRGFLEVQLSRALGQPVTIGGSIDLKLLPTPYIRLNQTVVGSDDGAVRIGIHHLDLELAVAPLLHGEFDIIEGRLDEPTIRLALLPDRSLPALPATPALKANIRLERILVRNGTLAVADPASGRTFVVDHLDFTAEAPSLAGPYKGSGTAGVGSERTRFRFSTTEPKKGSTHVHLALGETMSRPAIDLDGGLTLVAQGDGLRQSFDGAVIAAGRLVTNDGPPLPWRLSGPLKADAVGARMAGGELRVGGDDGLVFKADVRGTMGEQPSLVASFSAAQLDVDRMAGGARDPAKPARPPQLPSLRRLRDLAAAATPLLPTTLDVMVGNATWGGQPLSDLGLHVEPGAGSSGKVRATGEGPGGLHVAIEGSVAGGGTSFEGQAELGADDLPRATTWLRAVAPAAAPSRGLLPFAAAKLAATIRADADGVKAKDAMLDLDRSRLRGSVAVSFGDGARRPLLTADLQTAKLDLDALPDVVAIDRGSGSVDFDLKLAAGSASFANVGDGALDTGRIALDVGARGGRVSLHHIGVEDLGGASLSAGGSLEATAANFDARVDAARVDAVAALARRIAPGVWTDAFAARAASLAPTHMRVEVAFKPREADAKLALARLNLDGTAAATRVTASLMPGGGGRGSALEARAEAADGLGLLRQLGVPVSTDAAPLGSGRVVIDAAGDVSGPLETRLSAEIGTNRLAVNGRFDLFGKSHGGSGTADLNGGDFGPLLRALGVSAPDASRPVPASLAGGLAIGGNGLALSDLKGQVSGTRVSGTLKLVPPAEGTPTLTGTVDVDRLSLDALTDVVLGAGRPPSRSSAWSKDPFAAPAATLPRADLSLRAGSLDLGRGLVAGDAVLDLRTGPGFVAVARGAAALAGGRLGGGFTLRRDGRQATLEGSLTTDNVAVDVPALKATVSGKLDFAGGGETPLALVAGLAGGGAATMADALVPGADPAALPSVFTAVEEDALAVDEEAVTRAYEETAKAPLALGTRHFALALAGGSLTLSPDDKAPAASSGAVASRLDATLDLRQPQLVVKAAETLRELPKDWSGPPPAIVVTQAGPIEAPHRSVDVSAFLNAVAARAIARESARVEAYEFDLRERSLFNTRLQSDHRREADRLKAEADAKAAAEAARRAAAELARKAEAERRAKAEAARTDKPRADDGEAGGARAPTGGGDPSTDGPRFQTPPPGSVSDPAAAGRY